MKVIEIEIPIRDYWQSQDLLKHADFLVANSENIAEVREVYRRFFKLVAPYAISEKDKIWLYERAKSKSA
ncbi:MAG: hypothetical protein R3B45_04235 [Bdellovibrionota bacterium]